MQENNFEKQVKKEMEGFSLAPSEPVWEKIERQIPQQTRRRRFIAFIFLFTGLMVCGYLYYNKWNNAVHDVSLPSNNIAAVTEEKNDAGKTADIKETVDATTLTQQYSPLQKEKQTSINTPEKNNIETVAVPEKNKHFLLADKLNAADKQDHLLPVLTDTVLITTALETSANIDLQTITNFDEETVVAEKELSKTTTDNYTIDESKTAANQLDSVKKIMLKDSLLTTAATKKEPVKINTPKKWQLGVSGFLGKSYVSESLLGIIGLGSGAEKSADYTSGGSQGGLEQYQFDVKKQVKAKGAFSLGLALKKQLNKKSSFVTGIQYTRFNMQIETGARKDSAAVFAYNNSSEAPRTQLNDFYAAGSGSTYTTRYDLLQIPLIFEQRINSNKNLIFNWNAGLSISRLLSSNALVFDYGNQAFYNNQEFFRKTQVSVLAGLNMQFALSKKADINLGPQLEYSVQNLLRSKDYGNQHFISYGLKASVFFKK